MKNSSTLSPEITQKVSTYIDSHEEEMLADFKDLLRIPSFRGEEEPGMPFGRACAEAVEFSAQLFEKDGFSITRRGERGYALAKTGNTDKTLGVFCHCDVVNPDTGVWEQINDPFEPEIKDGYLIGRGSLDDKCAVIATLYALRALKSLGVQLKHNVLVYMGGNEETGMKDILNFREDQPMPDVSLVPDCAFPLFRGEKSFSRFEMLCDRTFERILSFSGGSPGGVCGDATVLLPNDPALKTELTAALEGRSELTLSENERGELVLTAQGLTAHPAWPVISVNAGALASGALLACPSLGENDLSILDVIYNVTSDMLGNYFGIKGHHEDFGDHYVVCCEISTRDGHPHLSCFTSYGANYSFKTLKETMCAKCREIGWDLTYTRGSKGFAVPEDHPVVQLVLRTYQELCKIRNFPEEAKTDTVSTFFAATYARHLRNAYCTGFTMPHSTPPAYFSPGHGHAHQSDECINIQCFKEGILYLAMMIAAVDNELDTLPSAND